MEFHTRVKMIGITQLNLKTLNLIVGAIQASCRRLHAVHFLLFKIQKGETLPHTYYMVT